MRSVAATAIALGLALAVIGFLPGERAGDRSDRAGGVPLLLFVSLAISPAILVYAEPRLRTGWRWMMWGLGLAAPAAGLITFGFEAHLASKEAVILWPRRAVELGTGTMLVIVLLVLPIVL